MPKANRKDSKGRVLRTGEDEIVGKGYRFRYTDAYGMRQSVYAPDLVSLRTKEKQIFADLNDGIDTRGGEISLNTQFEKYMKTKNKLSESTRLNYNYMWNLLVRNSRIGNMPIGAIRKSDVLIFYSELSKKGYKNKTIELVQRLIYPTLQLAVDDDILRKNVSSGCARDYSQSETNKEALTKNEQKIFVDFVCKSEYKRHLPLITFLLGTGCRIGETLGLTWDDVDFKENVIHINKQLIHQSVNGKMKFWISKTKTRAGMRDIPLTKTVREQLLYQKQTKMFLSMNSECEIDGYSNFVFVTNQGNVIQDESFYKTLQRICKGIREDGYPNFPNISAHILRHTACTRFAEAGMDIKVLQTIMGHEDIKMIMKVYNHAQKEHIAEQMEKFGDIVNL